MLGLAIMAAQLTYQRCGEQVHPWLTPDFFVPRATLRQNDGYVKSHEYYAICDRITRGEKP